MLLASSRRAVLAGLAGLTAFPVVSAAATGGETSIEIAQGRLRGYRNGDIHVFKGIPYGAPPAGPLRFQAPRPAPSWMGVREATQYGPSCPQIQVPNNYAKNLPPDVPPMTGLLGWGTDETKSEDCLVLN